MSVVFTGTLQGQFTSDGTAVTLNLPSGVDYLHVYNQTKAFAAGAGTGVQYYWQLGMTSGRGVIYQKTAVTNALTIGQIAAGAGFTLVDSSLNVPGTLIATTAISNATPPVVDTANTGTLVSDSGQIVRLYNQLGAHQLDSFDFTVGTVVANTSFELAFMQPIVASALGGFYAQIPFDPIFYPRVRTITNISQAAQARVTMSVTHGFTVGQVVSFRVPELTATTYGMTELNNLSGVIVDTGNADADGYTNTIDVDIDTTGFTAFTFPLTAGPFGSPAQVVPVGESTAEALAANLNILADATINTGYRGIVLPAGNNSPAGSANDVIYWVAGKSFSNTVDL